MQPGTLSVTATPCQLSQRESQGAGFARPAHRNYNVVQSAAQQVRRCKSGGAAALGSPTGGAVERSETERAFAVSNLGKVQRLQPGTLSVTATPCQLSQRESQGAGAARPAHRNYRAANPAVQSAQRIHSLTPSGNGTPDPYSGRSPCSQPGRQARRRLRPARCRRGPEAPAGSVPPPPGTAGFAGRRSGRW